MFIVNGETFPDLPINKKYVYTSIVKIYQNNSMFYMLFMTESKQCFVPASVSDYEWGGYDRIWSTANNNIHAACTLMNNEWGDITEYTDGTPALPIKDNEYILVWANHDIVTATHMSSSRKITLGTEVYFEASDITYIDDVTGLEFPVFPESLDEYPYKVVLKITDKVSDSGFVYDEYILLSSSSEIAYVPEDVASKYEYNGGYAFLYLSGGYIDYRCVKRSEISEWLHNGGYYDANQFLLGGHESIIWANHDIMKAIDRDENNDYTPIIGDEIYFESSVFTYDDVYYAKSEWFKSLADLVRKLYNTDKKLTSETILTELENYNLPYIEGVKF